MPTLYTTDDNLSLATETDAGFWLRAAAFTIDIILLKIASLLLGLATGATAFGVSLLFGDPGSPVIKNATMLIGGVLGLALAVLWFAGMEASTWQATVGKRIMGLKVVDAQGQRISLRIALGRYFGKILSVLTLGIGFMMAGWTVRKQALHDRLAGTYVVRR